MKKIITPVIKFAIDKVKRNKFVQNLFESPFDLSKFPKKGSFDDSYGNKIDLFDGLRTKIKPGWERMQSSGNTEISENFLKSKKEGGEIAINKILPIITSLGKTIEDCSFLEIGCHSGGTSFAAADLGAANVIGTEFSGYKVSSVENVDDKFENRLEEVNDHLKQMRKKLAKLYKHSGRVSFLDDDICNSKLQPSSFDVVCSWEVLEHLHDPEAAFKSIYNLLKDDGISIHEYNPFYCLNGGHSLCTLDFLWGHTRLSDNDFEKYIDQLRPDEKERALSFYRNGLNRMTLSQLDVYLKNAGLEIVSIIPFSKEQHLRMIDFEILTQTQKHYPSVTMQDLSSPRVFVIVRKNK